MISLLKLPLASNTELCIRNNALSGHASCLKLLKRPFVTFDKYSSCKHHQIRAQNDNPEYTSGKITEKEARDLLGVRESSTFEEILKAKKHLVQQTMDQSKISEVTSDFHNNAFTLIIYLD